MPSFGENQVAARSLVVGADGAIGAALVERLGASSERVIGTTRRQERLTADRVFFDLSSEAAVLQLETRVSQAFLCAGITSAAACEKDCIGTSLINVGHTVQLAKRLLEQRAMIVFPSTSRVFDGAVRCPKHTDKTSPSTAYGRQKALAEAELSTLAGRVAVVRLSKVIPPCFPLFQCWEAALRAGRACHPYMDVAFAPIPLDFAVDVLCRCGELRFAGVVQASSETQITYAEAARYLAIRLGVDPALIQPVRFQTDARSPAPRRFETLDISVLARDLGLAPPTVWETLDKTFSCGSSAL